MLVDSGEIQLLGSFDSEGFVLCSGQELDRKEPEVYMSNACF